MKKGKSGNNEKRNGGMSSKELSSVICSYLDRQGSPP